MCVCVCVCVCVCMCVSVCVCVCMCVCILYIHLLDTGGASTISSKWMHAVNWPTVLYVSNSYHFIQLIQMCGCVLYIFLHVN